MFVSLNPQRMLSNKDLVQYLHQNAISTSRVDRLKMTYRPYICPFNKLIPYVKEQDIVADIGCGSGQFSFLLAGFSHPKIIYGYEISEKLINNAIRLFKDCRHIEYHFKIYNGVDFPNSLGEADVVFLIDVLHHVPVQMRVRFLDAIHSKMKGGARLILKDINASSPFVYFNKLHDLLFSRETGHEISIEKAMGLLEKLNFKILHAEKERMYVYPHYTLVAEK